MLIYTPTGTYIYQVYQVFFFWGGGVNRVDEASKGQ